MPPSLALLIGVVLVLYALKAERHRNARVSKALIWPVVWYLVAASRPIGIWLQIWGIPVPGAGGDAVEGSFIDRTFYSGLIVIGVWVLSRRNIDWRGFFRDNGWLLIFVGFMLLSVLWSNYPSVSFKRFIKLVGSIVMAAIVLTETNQLEAITAVIRRCAYIHLPMSIIVIRYFRPIGITFDWSGGAVSWQGIATTKNVLGQVVMVATLYFLWETIRNWRHAGWKNLNFLYLLMGLYLLKGSDDAVSMTSVSVFAVGLIIFLRLETLKLRPAAVRSFTIKAMIATLALVTLVIVHGVVMFPEDSFFGRIITTMGRDITLTDRTVIWGQVFDVVRQNPVLGVGFGGFWIGRLANIPFTEPLTWTLGQAHSGYVDTYLQLGWIGAFLLAGLILSTCPRLLTAVRDNFELGQLRIVLFLTIIFVNITETTLLRGDHHMWFLFLIAILMIPDRSEELNLAAEDFDESSNPQEEYAVSSNLLWNPAEPEKFNAEKPDHFTRI